MSRHRVVQWATGNIGTRSLRGAIQHPDLELVGVRVHADAKAGVDAGTLCGLSPCGITATTDDDEIVGLGADCVLYMPRALDVDTVCRLLASGSNIVTTRGELHHPQSTDSMMRNRIEAACAEGSTSIHSTGSSPGFITEVIPVALTSIQRRLDALAIEEYADLSRRSSPELLFDLMGFGVPPAELHESRLAHGRTSFGPSLRLVADAIGLPLDDIVANGAVAVAADDVEIAAGTIPRGRVAAQKVNVEGVRDGRVLLRFTATWYCTTNLDPAWELRSTGWRVVVDGDAPLDVELAFPVSLDQMAEVAPGYTANRAVNAVPAVCAAEPGIRTVVDLPPVIARLG
jgi:4-hydroxy-tetrahydrodipicolinate reductase